MSDTRPRRSAGFGTRALAAATRNPVVEQQPDAVPIYQAVTFSAGSAAELADVLGDRRAGYSYSRIDNPTSKALADALAEVEGDAGRVRVCDRHGRHPRRVLVTLSAATTLSPASRFTAASSTCSRTFCRASASRQPSSIRPIRTQWRRPSRRTPACCTSRRSPTRRSSWPIWARSSSAPTARHPGQRRQHVRLGVAVPAGRARR